VKRFHILIALALTGCATSAAFRSGERAERRQDYDRAVVDIKQIQYVAVSIIARNVNSI